MVNENITHIFLGVSSLSVNPSYYCSLFLCKLLLINMFINYSPKDLSVLSKKFCSDFKRLVPFQSIDHWLLNYKNLFLRGSKRIITTFYAQQIAMSSPMST